MRHGNYHFKITEDEKRPGKKRIQAPYETKEKRNLNK